MPRIRCRFIDCYYLESGYCTAETVLIDPDEGCLTFSHIDDLALSESDDWQMDEMEEIEALDNMDEVWGDDGDDDGDEEEELDGWIEDDELI
jgi:hypothetical protein